MTTTEVAGVIFDLGRTLLYVPDDFDEETLIATCMGLPSAVIETTLLELTAAYPGSSADDFIRIVADHFSARAGRSVGDRITAICHRSIEAAVLQWDAVPALNRLRDAGLATCLISNTNPLSKARIEAAGLGRHLDHVILSCDAELWKPDPRIFQLGFRKMGLPPANICVTGDRIRTIILGTSYLGCHTVLVERRMRKPMMQTNLPVTAIVPHLHAMCDLALIGA